jgi:hypothetical protein
VARGFIAGKAEGIEDGAASSAAGRPGRGPGSTQSW